MYKQIPCRFSPSVCFCYFAWMKKNLPILFSGRLFALLTLASALFASCKTTKSASDDIYSYALDEVTIAAHPQYKGEASKPVAIQHTRLELKPIWERSELEGKAVLTISPYAYPQDSVNLDAKGFILHSVKLNIGNSEKPLSYTYDSTKLHIRLDRMYEPGESFKVAIAYTARPEVWVARPEVKKEEKGLYFINPLGKDTLEPRELWSQGETNYNSIWFPTIDETNQKFTQEIYLTVDTSMVTLSNGNLVYSNLNNDGTRTDYWQMEKPHSAYLAMIAAGNWKITEDSWRDSIPVKYYLEPQYAPYAHLIFGKTPRMIEYFSQLFDYPYPWPSFSQVVVREFVSGAMENTTAVVHFEPVQHDARAHLDESYEDIISHELFHHWFGDLVTAESWANLALNESFATLGEELWIEHEEGQDAADYHSQVNLEAYLAEAAFIKEPIINHYYQDAEDLFDRHRYEKGGLVLNMLRQYVGDTVFFHALHNYLVAHAYKNVEISDLRKAFEDEAGEDLTWFFDQWFEKPGHPELLIKHRYAPQEQKLYVSVEQMQKGSTTPFFRMPVAIDIYTGQGQKKQEKVWLMNKKDTFVFNMPNVPMLVDFDVDKVLLAQKKEVKPLAEWYYQYFNCPRYLAKYEALSAIAPSARLLSTDSLKRLIDHALSYPFWNIRKLALDHILQNAPENVEAGYEDKIKQMALKDPSPMVRTSALQHLGLKLQEKALPQYTLALSDSSYNTVAEAMRQLRLHTPKADSMALLNKIKPYESYKSGVIAQVITDLYALYPTSSNLIYFNNALYYLSTYQVPQYLDNYTTFIKKLGDVAIRDQADWILGLSKRIKDQWGNIAYRNMLNELTNYLKKGEKGIATEERQKLMDQFKQKSEELKLNSAN